MSISILRLSTVIVVGLADFMNLPHITKALWDISAFKEALALAFKKTYGTLGFKPLRRDGVALLCNWAFTEAETGTEKEEDTVANKAVAASSAFTVGFIVYDKVHDILIMIL